MSSWTHRRVVGTGPENPRRPLRRSAGSLTVAAIRVATWLSKSVDRRRGQARAGSPGTGHRHVWSLLRVHSVLRGQGVAAAMRELTLPDIARAVTAYRYFGLDGLAGLLKQIPDAASSSAGALQFDREYRDVVGAGDLLVAAVRRTMACRPQDFPLDCV
jgi:hypothetical protein